MWVNILFAFTWYISTNIIMYRKRMNGMFVDSYTRLSWFQLSLKLSQSKPVNGQYSPLCCFSFWGYLYACIWRTEGRHWIIQSLAKKQNQLTKPLSPRLSCVSPVSQVSLMYQQDTDLRHKTSSWCIQRRISMNRKQVLSHAGMFKQIPCIHVWTSEDRQFRKKDKTLNNFRYVNKWLYKKIKKEIKSCLKKKKMV